MNDLDKTIAIMRVKQDAMEGMIETMIHNFGCLLPADYERDLIYIFNGYKSSCKQMIDDIET